MNPDMPCPLYKHDCDECKFIGTVEDFSTEIGRTYDLYACPQMEMPTLVARYGGSGPDYLSNSECSLRLGGVRLSLKREVVAALAKGA